VDDIFTLRAQFIEEDGYEPPQGYLQQVVEDNDDGTTTQPRFQIVSSRWQLSEDRNERQGGLWVWGLFQEPLYPFLELQLETAAIPLPGGGGGDENKGDAIKPLKLFAQLTHSRDPEAGVILSERNDLKVREMETFKADPFGAATVEVYEEISIGNLQVQPKKK
jgi:hypothetical protein